MLKFGQLNNLTGIFLVSGYFNGFSSPELSSARHHSTRQRQQRSFRNDKHTSSPEQNTFAPPRIHNKSEALFFTENSTIITAQIGSKTHLPCAVRNLGSGVVSLRFFTLKNQNILYRFTDKELYSTFVCDMLSLLCYMFSLLFALSIPLLMFILI